MSKIQVGAVIKVYWYDGEIETAILQQLDDGRYSFVSGRWSIVCSTENISSLIYNLNCEMYCDDFNGVIDKWEVIKYE